MIWHQFIFGVPMKSLLRMLVRLLVQHVFRIDVSYSSKALTLSKNSKTVITCNHVSLLDGVIICVLSPVPLVFAVELAFSRENKLTAKGMALLSWLGFGSVIAVDSRSPFGMRQLLKALDANQPVMIFPEGKISTDGRPTEHQPGVDWLLSKSGAKVLQACIRGPEQSMFFGKSGTYVWPKIKVDF